MKGPKPRNNARGQAYVQAGGDSMKRASCPGVGQALVAGRCPVCQTILNPRVKGGAPPHNMPAWMRERERELELEGGGEG